MRLSRKRLLIATAVSVAVVGAWLAFNGPGRFGPSCYGYISYNALPRPLMDFQVRADGALRRVPKTHDVGAAELAWLLDAPPEVLILCKGWSGGVRPRPDVEPLGRPGLEVRILPTGEALDLFNRLRKAGRRVAIHVHSTC